MNIAVIGWGSLIWDMEILSPHVEGAWQMQAGPLLPMEFSRISLKRKLGLVVCLDTTVGVDCATHVIRSTRTDIEATVEDLRARERAPLGRIGGVHRGGFQRGRRPEVIETVRAWCEKEGWHGAVWTDLEPNFEAHTKRGFTVEEGIRYLKTLGGESLEEAYTYIQNAPAQTATPLRAALAEDMWWQGIGAGR